MRNSLRLGLASSFLLAAPVGAGPSGGGKVSDGYHDHAGLVKAVDSIQHLNPKLTSVTTLATSPGGRVVQVVRLAAGDNPDTRPGILVIANASGPHVVGSEVALGLMRSLINDYGKVAAVTDLLDHRVV